MLQLHITPSRETGQLPLICRETGLLRLICRETGLLTLICRKTGLITLMCWETGLLTLICRETGPLTSICWETGLLTYLDVQVLFSLCDVSLSFLHHLFDLVGGYHARCHGYAVGFNRLLILVHLGESLLLARTGIILSFILIHKLQSTSTGGHMLLNSLDQPENHRLRGLF